MMVTRAVSGEEADRRGLGRVYAAGQVVRLYEGPTYGVIAPDGIAIWEGDGFAEMPEDALAPVGDTAAVPEYDASGLPANDGPLPPPVVVGMPATIAARTNAAGWAPVAHPFPDDEPPCEFCHVARPLAAATVHRKWCIYYGGAA